MNENYTCNDYREEMILLGLRRRLASENLGEEEKTELMRKIKKYEKNMGID